MLIQFFLFALHNVVTDNYEVRNNTWKKYSAMLMQTFVVLVSKTWKITLSAKNQKRTYATINIVIDLLKCNRSCDTSMAL